mgnify:CR=1 FL=1
MLFIFFAVSFGASFIGGICGIGGGVIIKPLLDFFDLASVSAASFLSGCTVLSMSLYNVSCSLLSRRSAIDLRAATPLAVGAAAGGVFGNRLFSAVGILVGSESIAGATQSLCLMALTLGTLLYTVKKSGIRTKSVANPLARAGVGAVLGGLSSFLGIGGGPFNLVILHYFFGMNTKMAVENSLYIILISQATNLMSTLLARSVPEFSGFVLILMALGGVGGGVAGRACSRHLDSAAVDRLFIGLLMVIAGICVYNTGRYLMSG